MFIQQPETLLTKFGLNCAVFLIILGILVPKIGGFGSGAGSNACNTLRPGSSHGDPSTNASPYTVTVLNNPNDTYTSGTKVSVEVTTTGESFQGLFLQARREDGQGVVGTWDTPSSNTNTRTMECSSSGDTITHANTNAKTTVTFSWNPPDSNVGDVAFTGVVAKQKTTWWNNQRSRTLAFKAGSSQTNNNGSPGQNDDEDEDSGCSLRNASTLSFTAVLTLSFCVIYST